MSTPILGILRFVLLRLNRMGIVDNSEVRRDESIENGQAICLPIFQFVRNLANR